LHLNSASRCALLLAALFCAGAARASTIFKVSLGEVGADVAMNAQGVLGTVNDGNAATTGDQNTAVEFTSFLDFVPDIPTNIASFTLSGLLATGPATVVGSTVLQPFLGGSFQLFDSANTLLLSGSLTNSQLAGTLGPPGTGAVFSTALGTITGGTLASLIAPGTMSLSMDMTQVNGGAGFSVGAAAPILNPFQADASVLVAANPVPEPAGAALLLIGAGVTALRRRR
jgi:hypothetical protein